MEESDKGEIQRRNFFRRITSFLEGFRDRTHISNSSTDRLRKSRDELQRTFPKSIDDVQGRFSRMEEAGFRRRLDEKVPNDVHTTDNRQMKDTRTREEKFAQGVFQWIKTERRGDISRFSHLLEENGIEWICFQDATRVNSAFLGDVILLHESETDAVAVDGSYVPPVEPEAVVSSETYRRLTEGLEEAPKNVYKQAKEMHPVNAIFEKAKKRNVKLTIDVNVKIPALDVYSVIRDNFENVDDILIENVISQVEGKVLKDAIRVTLLNMYTKKKKANVS